MRARQRRHRRVPAPALQPPEMLRTCRAVSAQRDLAFPGIDVAEVLDHLERAVLGPGDVRIHAHVVLAGHHLGWTGKSNSELAAHLFVGEGIIKTHVLLSIVAAEATGEVRACDLPDRLGRTQATISHHLSLLVKAGVLTREQRGKWAWFRIRPERFEARREALAVPATIA
jgi:DNA-binding transcriptional ArsR family regulator